MHTYRGAGGAEGRDGGGGARLVRGAGAELQYKLEANEDQAFPSLPGVWQGKTPHLLSFFLGASVAAASPPPSAFSASSGLGGSSAVRGARGGGGAAAEGEG